MDDPLRTDPSRLKVYALLAEGRAQAKVIELTGLDKGYVSRTAKALVDTGHLRPINPKGRPILYEKGPEGPKLDKLLVDSKLTVYDRGVTPVAANYARVDTGKTHHLKFKMKVLREGQLKFYKVGARYRNVQRSYAQVPYKDRFLKVELERSFKAGGKGTTLYVYPPDLDLTAEELPRYEEIAAKIVMEVANYMMKNLGWQLGLPELTNWDVHIGIDNPALMKGLAEKYFMRSQDGKVWTSDSDGRSELETGDIARAQILLDLPGEVLTIKTTMVDLVEDLKLIVEALSLSKDGMERVAVINGIELKTKAKEALERLQENTDGSKAAVRDREENDPGVMFG